MTSFESYFFAGQSIVVDKTFVSRKRFQLENVFIIIVLNTRPEEVLPDELAASVDN